MICQREIPDTRKRDAVTCTPACSKLRKDYIRSCYDRTHCRYCAKPSTHEQRESYKLWKKWEKLLSTADLRTTFKRFMKAENKKHAAA